MKKIILFFALLSTLIACGETCYNAPQPIVFEFVNSNDDNLITTGILTDIIIKESNNQPIKITKTESDKIVLENVGSYHGTKEYTFTSNIKFFNFSIESSEFNAGCEGYQINKLTFTGTAFDVVEENGYYKIIFDY